MAHCAKFGIKQNGHHEHRRATQFKRQLKTFLFVSELTTTHCDCLIICTLGILTYLLQGYTHHRALAAITHQ